MDVELSGVVNEATFELQCVLGQDGPPLLANKGVVGDSEAFYVLDDRRAARVAVYSRECKYLGQIGARGQGSGEFQAPSQIVAQKRGGIGVYDTSNRALLLMNSAGFEERRTHLRESLCYPIILLEDAIFACVRGKDGRGYDVSQPALLGPDGRSLLHFPEDFQLRNTGQLLHPSPPQGKRNLLMFFGSSFWYTQPIAVLDDGTLVVAKSDSYSIVVVDRSGRAVREIVVDEVARPLPEADYEAVAGFFPDLPGLPGWARAQLDEFTLPFVLRLAVLPGDVIVAFVAGTEPPEERVDVFSASGTYYGRWALPSSISRTHKGTWFGALESPGDTGTLVPVYRPAGEFAEAVALARAQ